MQNRSNETDSEPSSSPAVNYIVQTLEQRIRLGHYAVGQRLPTERVLADEFEVSRTTVRHSLDELERRGLLERSNGCRPLISRPQDRTAPRETDDRKRVCVWISASPADSGAHSALQGIQQELSRCGFDMLLDSPPGARGWEEAICAEAAFLARVASDRLCAGVILWYLGGERNRACLQAVRSAGIAMVCIDRPPPPSVPADYVGIENELAAFLVTRHLIACGHRHIAHVTNAEQADTVRHRLAGYRRALLEADLPFHPDLVFRGDFMEANDEATERARHDIVDALLGANPHPTALFAVNDYYALSLISALRTRGVRVPEEMAVAGFDDLERWIPGDAFVTTIRQPFERMGVEAVRLLERRLQRQRDDDYQRVMLEAPLVVRHSTAVAAHADALPSSD